MSSEDPADIQYDSQKKQAIIFFRGKRIVLPESYATEAEAITAGKAWLAASGQWPSEIA